MDLPFSLEVDGGKGKWECAKRRKGTWNGGSEGTIDRCRFAIRNASNYFRIFIFTKKCIIFRDMLVLSINSYTFEAFF